MDYSTSSAEELVEECAHTGRPEAWKEFVRRFHPVIAGVVVTTATRCGGLCAAVVDDLVQETYLRLCTQEWRRLREFQSYREGAIFGFMKVVARTVTLDYLKAQHTSKRGAEARARTDMESALRTAARDLTLEEHILVREVKDRLGQIEASTRDRLIFFLYFQHGLTTKAIAAIPGIELSQKGVESCLYRLTRLLQRELIGPAGRFSPEKFPGLKQAKQRTSGAGITIAKLRSVQQSQRREVPAQHLRRVN